MSVAGISTSNPVPALQGLVRRDQLDLQDWLTCVSASTPKGKAEIQSLSAQISAARSEIDRAQQNESATHSASLESTLTYSPPTSAQRAAGATPPSQVDVWA